MHTLHFGVINADSPKEACLAVDAELGSWGDENNWRSIGGCVSDKDETYIHDTDACFYPENNSNTIEKLNAWVTSWIDPCKHNDKKILKLMNKAVNGKKLNFHDWYSIENFAKYKSEANNRVSLNILKDDYYTGIYDKNGVTQFTEFTGKGTKKYVVFIDMHS